MLLWMLGLVLFIPASIVLLYVVCTVVYVIQLVFEELFKK